MTFGADDMVRIEGEFLTLSCADVWERVEDALWLRKQRERANWSAYGKWWEKTSAGKRHRRAYHQKHNAELQAVVVAVVACKGCGKLIGRTELQRRRGTGRFCSPQCSGPVRLKKLLTLDGESLTLARWIERYGMNRQTVWLRLKRGWSLRDALQKPSRQCAARRAAPGEKAV